MRRGVLAWSVSGLHLVTAPGLVAGVGPWLVTRWEVGEHPGWFDPVRWLGLVGTAVAAALVVVQFVRFARAGGSPAPPVPTQTLVTGGSFRYVRNPMYLAVVTAVVGQALWFVDGWLLAYALLAFAVMAGFVVGYEEPTLQRQFGDAYAQYCADVPRWVPRRPRYPGGQRDSVRAR